MSLILLEKIKNHESTTKIFLEKWLCPKILSSNQDPKVYLYEVISSGGKTGGIGELIYYKLLSIEEEFMRIAGGSVLRHIHITDIRNIILGYEKTGSLYRKT